MSAIGETSTSYPFLALARRRQLDYEAVLTLAAHFLNKLPSGSSVSWAARCLDIDDLRAVKAEARLERERHPGAYD